MMEVVWSSMVEFTSVEVDTGVCISIDVSVVDVIIVDIKVMTGVKVVLRSVIEVIDVSLKEEVITEVGIEFTAELMNWTGGVIADIDTGLEVMTGVEVLDVIGVSVKEEVITEEGRGGEVATVIEVTEDV